MRGACRRHRGKSPRQAAFFFRNAELNFQSAQLASLYVMYGLLCGTRLQGSSRAIASGRWSRARCSVRPTRRTWSCTRRRGISFEHAWFLLLALARRDEVGISRCAVCGGVRLRDLLAKHKLACGTCGPADSARRGYQCAAPC